MLKRFSAVLIAACTGLFLCSCATKYDTDQKLVYVDRESLEDKDPSEILSQAVDTDRMEDEKKLNIGVILTVNDMTGKWRLPNLAGLQHEALKSARAYLVRTNAYRVVILQEGAKKEIMSGKDFDGVKYPFLIDMNIELAADIKEAYDHDEAMYKTTLTWTLIDNRTKSNGLGELDAPTGSQANVCRSLCPPIDLQVSSLSGSAGVSGSNKDRAINQLLNAMRNSLVEFQAQLVNRIPFGGKVRELWELDDKIYMRLRDAEKMGVVPGMQMMIINERGNKIAIATATGGNKGITLEIWRWLSKSMKEKICKVAGDEEAAVKYLKKKSNRLYAVCLGMPRPAKDEIIDFRDTK